MLRRVWDRIQIEVQETLLGFLLLPLLPFVALAALISFLIPALLRPFLAPHPNSYATDARVDLWMTLSELYADTEPSDECIARTLRESGLSRNEIFHVFEVDVGPACFPLGPWMGFDRDELVERILRNGRSYKVTAQIPIIGFIVRRFFTSLYRADLVRCLDLSKVPDRPSVSAP